MADKAVRAAGELRSRQGPAKRAGRPTTKQRAAMPPSGPERVAGRDTHHLVVGRISPAVRVVGVLAVLAAACLAVRPFLPLARRPNGDAVGSAVGVLGLLGWAPAVLVLVGAGVLCLRGRLPRLAMATVAAAAATSIGPALRTIWLLDTAHRSVLDLPVGGQALAGGSYRVGSGLLLSLVAAGVLILALVFVVLGWAGTVMEDGGPLDRFRPALGVGGFFLGVFAALSFGLNPSDSPVGIAPATVTGQAGLERTGGLVLAALVVVCCVAAATVRPWLASLGTLLGVFVVLCGLAVENLVVVTRSPDLTVSFGAGARVVAAALVLLATVGAAVISAPLPQSADEPVTASNGRSRPQARKQKRARVGG